MKYLIPLLLAGCSAKPGGIVPMFDKPNQAKGYQAEIEESCEEMRSLLPWYRQMRVKDHVESLGENRKFYDNIITAYEKGLTMYCDEAKEVSDGPK